MLKKTAKVIPIDKAFVARLRKEFLKYMRNVKEVHDYDSALDFKKVGNKYAENFKEMFFDRFTNKYLLYHLGLSKSTAEYWQKLLNKVGWDFYLEISPPLSRADDYHGKESRYYDYQQEVRRWSNRVKDKARKLWKELKDFIHYYPTYRDVEEKVTPYVELMEDENYSIAGFDTVLRGYDEKSEYALRKLRIAEAGFKAYRERASERLPWLLKHSVPFILRFDLSLDKAGEYNRFGEVRIELYLSAFLGEKHPVDRFVKVCAHEMAHHLWYFYLGEGAKDFWNKAVRSDYEQTLDLQHVLDTWKNPKPDHYIALMEDDFLAEGDVETYLQVSTLLWQPGTKDWWERATYRDVEEKIEAGERYVHVPQHPISGYAGKSGSEAFAEAVGNYVAFGEKGVYPLVRKWLSIVLPTAPIRTAQALYYSGAVYRRI